MPHYGREKPNFGPAYYSPLTAPDMAPSLTERFDRDLSAVIEARGQVYAHPAVDFSRAAQIERVVLDCPDPRIRHVLLMLATKLARLVQSPHHYDSWLDIAGYARTALMVIDTQDEKEGPAREEEAG